MNIATFSSELYDTSNPSFNRSGKWSIDSIPAFCITLERRPDRWKKFQNQPGYSELNIQKFNGVDGKTIDIRNDDRVALSTKRNILLKTRRSHEELDSVGGVGCALSHIALWKWMIENQEELIVVFEDDAKLPKGVVLQINNHVKNSETLKNYNQWDMFVLGSTRQKFTVNGGHSPNPVGENIIDIHQFYGMYAYVITRKCAEKFLQRVFPIHCHIDLWVCLYKQIHGLKILGHRVFNLKTNGSKTEIQTSNYCYICNVPSDYKKDFILLKKREHYLGLMCELIVAGGTIYLVYRGLRK